MDAIKECWYESAQINFEFQERKCPFRSIALQIYKEQQPVQFILDPGNKIINAENQNLMLKIIRLHFRTAAHRDKLFSSFYRSGESRANNYCHLANLNTPYCYKIPSKGNVSLLKYTNSNETCKQIKSSDEYKKTKEVLQVAVYTLRLQDIYRFKQTSCVS